MEHLGDGTFGRALKCKELLEYEHKNESLPQILTSQSNVASKQDQSMFAIKVVRAVPRYTESAKFEAQILKDLHT